jgi:predicted lipoprotein with Yx(FWY)xxD motif
MNWLRAAIVFSLGGCLFAAVEATAATPPSSHLAARAGASVDIRFNKQLKQPILVDGRGRTLYLFTADVAGHAGCVGNQPAPGCGKIWPPLTSVGAPRAGKGVKADLLGTTRRSDGRVQVTYNRHALYEFHGLPPELGVANSAVPGDRKPGDVRGQGLFDLWYAVSPAGKPIKHAASGA